MKHTYESYSTLISRNDYDKLKKIADEVRHWSIEVKWWHDTVPNFARLRDSSSLQHDAYMRNIGKVFEGFDNHNFKVLNRIFDLAFIQCIDTSDIYIVHYDKIKLNRKWSNPKFKNEYGGILDLEVTQANEYIYKRWISHLKAYNKRGTGHIDRSNIDYTKLRIEGYYINSLDKIQIQDMYPI